MVKRVKIRERVDRISSLPDSVLGHILSFLPTKVAVSTSILLIGSRWRDVFPTFKNLDFDESLVYNPRRNDPYGRTYRFKDFVDRCIMLKNGTHIDKFRLKCRGAVETSRIHLWICAAQCSNVRELDLCIGTRNLGEEFSLVFTCNTLVVLKLGAGVSLNASVCFPCLKILHLDSISLAHNGSLIQRLISSCPVLEDLLIGICYVPVLDLSSPSLKRLAIDKPFDYCPYKLVLDTPSLVYLKFTLCMGEGHILKNLGSLREVHVDISRRLEDGIACHELLERLGNVGSLHLSGNVEMFLQKRLPRLKSLTRLVLTGRIFWEMSLVIELLHCCPNLEEFVTDGSIYGGYGVPFCVPSRLKSIECALFYYRAFPYHEEAESLEYFLMNANMLEKIQIHIPSYCSVGHRGDIEKLDTMMVTMNELAKAPSRSKICEINVIFKGKRIIFSR